MKMLTEVEAWREIARLTFETGKLPGHNSLCDAIHTVIYDLGYYDGPLTDIMIRRIRGHVGGKEYLDRSHDVNNNMYEDYTRGYTGRGSVPDPNFHVNRAMFALLLAEEAETGL